MRTTLLSLSLCLAALLQACATQGPPFQAATAEPGAALVYLYRPSSIVGGANDYLAALDGKVYARMKSGSYFVLRHAPGRIAVSRKAASGILMGWGPGSIVGALEGFVQTGEFEARAGQRYFVHFPRGTLTVDEAEALRDMAGTELLPQYSQ